MIIFTKKKKKKKTIRISAVGRYHIHTNKINHIVEKDYGCDAEDDEEKRILPVEVPPSLQTLHCSRLCSFCYVCAHLKATNRVDIFVK